MTADTFDAGMAILFATFPGLSVENPTLKAWRNLLSDVEDQSFLDAVKSICLAEKDIYPGTNIVALIREKALDPTGIGHPLPGEAWGEVKVAVRRFGYYQVPEFSDPLISRTIEMLGWKEYCASNVGEESAWRAHFMRIYESLIDREAKQRMYGIEEFAGRKRLGKGEPPQQIGEIIKGMLE